MADRNLEFSRRLNELRKNRFGGSQKALAAEIGISESSIGNYLSGRVPTPAKLKLITEFFNVDTDWLLYGEGKSYESEPKTVPEDDRPQDESQARDPVDGRYLYGIELNIENYLSMARQILESRDPTLVTALRQNILAFHESLSNKLTLKNSKTPVGAGKKKKA